MVKKNIWIVVGVLVGAAIVYGAVFVWNNLRGIGPALRKPPVDISTVINTTGMPLIIPDGFSIAIVADDIPGARVLRFHPDGSLWVSQPGSGALTKISLKNGQEESRSVAFSGLDGPHGFVFDPIDSNVIYIAEEGRVIESNIINPGQRSTLLTLPNGGGHSTRTLGVGPDNKLYVTIGSSCNVCRESDAKRAAMWVMDRDGSNARLYATGLRNTVFFTWRDGELWGTDMGRDLLGDNTPPDEINVIQDGKDYGWPFCYGQRVHDKKFDNSSATAGHCLNSEPSTVNLQAHSAPLGLVFIPKDSNWPEEYRNNLIVAYHGSWNRTEPTGYKLVRFSFSGNEPQPVKDFITGWLVKAGAIGRPADVIFHEDALFVSDDKAGVVYQIKYKPVAVATGTCRRTGCSGQVCSEKETVTDCLFRAEYSCYTAAECTRQTDGNCGWTETTELRQCLTEKSQ